uniref:Uncharacterized protein n=1 Tax=Escherichia coli TaxID=562 RepID=Q1RPM3_ECOLX|nr:hypothetical protein eco1011 [Escherichia coli]
MLGADYDFINLSIEHELNEGIAGRERLCRTGG